MKKLSWLAGAVAATALLVFASPAQAQQPTTQEKDQKQAQQQQANPSQQAQSDTSCIPTQSQQAQHDTSRAAKQDPSAANRKPCTPNQSQSGVTSSTGTSTLGENVTKPKPDASQPVTAKGDTLKKPAQQPSPN